MNVSFLLVAMLCVGVIVIGAIVVLVVLLTKDKRTRPKDVSISNAGPNWTRWLPYLGVALLLAFWSYWISLLFLVTVWLLRTNPGKDATYEVGDNEKKTAKRVYTWLFWSPVITVPVFLIAYENASYQINDLVFAALLPLIFHTPLLLGLTSKSAFVYRHTQQGILLIAVRAATAAIAASMDSYEMFYFINGGLWLFGTLLARNQVIRNECWLMKRKAETLILNLESSPKSENQLPASSSPQKSMEYSRLYLKQNQKASAVRLAVEAFNNGDREIRQQAVQLLETLDEVEQF